jgi:hypothetical protein
MVESAGLVARPAAEEEAATGDWTIAPTPIPPDTTDAELVALWLHGKSRTPSGPTATTLRPSDGSPASRCGRPTWGKPNIRVTSRHLTAGG